MKRSERAVLAQETLDIIECGGYRTPSGGWVDLGGMVKRCLDETILYQPGDLEDLARCPANGEQHPDIAVRNETTLMAARRFSREGGKVAVLNFASARNPGGGFLDGSQAQEESLARSSALYVSLRRCPEFYEHHRGNADLCYSHRMIVSPACPVFRDDDGLLLEEPYSTTFITSPAPNAGAIRNRQPEQAHRIRPVLRERARMLLALANHLRVETLVLGAWGCGVFQNDPAEVAAAFATLLDPTMPPQWSFRRVTFAVLDRSPAATALAAFEAHFAGINSF